MLTTIYTRMMFRRSKLEEWYEGKKTDLDVSECGMVGNANFSQLFDIEHVIKKSIFSEYGNSNGEVSLINALSNIYGCYHENILVTNGAGEALFVALLALCDNCSKLACQLPYYTDFNYLLNKIGCSITQFSLTSDSLFRFNFDQFTKAFADCSVALLNYPNNPTGSELRDEEYTQILDYARHSHKIVIFDETTAISKTFIEKNIRHHWDNCICINSLSKTYGIPGIRVGWIIADRSIIEECRAIKELISICTSPLLQEIACNILRYRETFIRINQQIMLANMSTLMQYISKHNFPLTICRVPQNIACCFVRIPDTISDYDFCLKLYDTYGVLLTPGSSFGLQSYFRLGLGVSPDIFNEAMRKIYAFISDYYAI